MCCAYTQRSAALPLFRIRQHGSRLRVKHVAAGGVADEILFRCFLRAIRGRAVIFCDRHRYKRSVENGSAAGPNQKHISWQRYDANERRATRIFCVRKIVDLTRPRTERARARRCTTT